jgi:ComF family protein
MFKRFQHATRSLQALLLGQRCAACQQPCEGPPVCMPCTAKVLSSLPRCPSCATPQGKAALCGACISKPPAFDAAVCVGSFTDPLSQLVAQFKFAERLILATWFADCLEQRIKGLSFDLIVPVPLFDKRLTERGFNQAWEIIKCMQTSTPRAHALTRLRDTPSQRSVSAAQRFANVRNAFAANESVRGLRVLLVDDVVTTTATAQAASKALKSAGAAHVTVACIARVTD